MKIKEKVLVIPGAPIEGANPLPSFRPRKPNVPPTSDDFPEELKVGLGCHNKVLPYLVQDRYSKKRLPLRIKCFELENEYLRAEFLPEYGGRLYSLYDKVNGADLVMRNPVIQPANLAIRNAWLSGGIEWNIGVIGHTFTTCDNVFAAKLNDGEGNEFLRIYEFERLKSTFWQVDFHLPEGSKHLIVHVKIVNPFNEATTTYWWSNTAAPDIGKTRVLASEDYIISFVDGAMRYEKLPHISAMPGADVSYPIQATRSFDFFIQAQKPDACTWEAAAYEDGLTLYERSTPPLTCKKLFCWGNHRAAKHWQEFLSDKGQGYYAEIQAGIAPSQLHDRLMSGNEVLEWTQCFGGVKGDAATLNDPNYGKARDYLGAIIDSRMSSDMITELNEKYKVLANMPVTEDMIVHTGSGFGALEKLRMQMDNDGVVPISMCFPAFTMSAEQYPWKFLLENGVFPEEDGRYFVPTYSVSLKWLKHIENSLNEVNGKSWYSLMQYGIAVYDGTDLTKYAAEAYSDEENDERTRIAEASWLESLKLTPTAIVYRNLAVLEMQRNNHDKSEEYYDKAVACDGAYDDFALAAEYLTILVRRSKYKKAWDSYLAMPYNCKAADRVKIIVATAAVKLGEYEYLDNFFKEEHYDIREGENSLTDVWFEYCARKMAKERGITDLTDEILEDLKDEAWDKYPPDESIDFRMSLDRKNKYRVG